VHPRCKKAPFARSKASPSSRLRRGNPALYADLTQTTPGDIDAWIDASSRHQLAPGTLATRLRLMQGFFACLGDQGYV
jgi:hypothetical protein